MLVRGERTVAVGGGLAGGCLAEFLSIEMQSRHHGHSVYVGSTRPIRGGGRRQAGAGRDRDGGNVGAHRDSHLEMCDAYRCASPTRADFYGTPASSPFLPALTNNPLPSRIKPPRRPIFSPASCLLPPSSSPSLSVNSGPSPVPANSTPPHSEQSSMTPMKSIAQNQDSMDKVMLDMPHLDGSRSAESIYVNFW